MRKTKIIATLLTHHRFGSSSINFEPLTQEKLGEVLEWNQSKVSHTIQARLSQLEAHDAYRLACPCRTEKPSAISMAKIDVAQFVKAASLTRGTR